MTNNYYQKGGFIIGKPEEISDFIKNSTITYLTHGSFGHTFVCTLKEGIETNLKYMDLQKFNEPVKKILIKLSFLHTDHKRKDLKQIFYNDKKKHINIVYYDNFIREVNTQIEIFFKSYETLQSICPSILNAEIIDLPKYILLENANSNTEKKNYKLNKDLDERLKHFYDSSDKLKIIIDSLIYNNVHNNFHIGLIAMEYAEDYNTLDLEIDELVLQYDNLYTKRQNTKNIKIKMCYLVILCGLLIINLALLGFSHGDFHIKNILINNNDSSFINSLNYRPFLIDFGLTTKLTLEQHKYVIKCYDERNYLAILNYIYVNVPRADGLFLYDRINTYGYIVGLFDVFKKPNKDKFYGSKNNDYYMDIRTEKPKAQFNYDPFTSFKNSRPDYRHIKMYDFINILFNYIKWLRQIQIDENIKIFNNKDKEQRNNILLPLDISHIGKMFKGIFPEINIKQKNNTITNISIPKKSLLYRISRKLTKPIRTYKEKQAKQKNQKEIFYNTLPFPNRNNIQLPNSIRKSKKLTLLNGNSNRVLNSQA